MRRILFVLLGVIIFVVAAVLGVLWWSLHSTAPAPALSFTSSSTPSTANQTSFTGTPNTASTTSSGSAASIIDPGSDAPQIVGDNLMLGLDQNSKLGNYLIGYTGRTVYAFEKDIGASSTCYAQCASIWPPYVVSPSDAINTEYGVNASKVSVITRTDGTLQVAYNGHPLYFYSGDTGGDSTLGQGVSGVWYVVAP